MRTTTTQITIRLTDDQKRRIEAQAEKEKRPVANLVKLAIDEYLAARSADAPRPAPGQETGNNPA